VLAHKLAEQPGEQVTEAYLCKLLNASGSGGLAEYFAEQLIALSARRQLESETNHVRGMIANGATNDDIYARLKQLVEHGTQSADSVGRFAQMVKQPTNRELQPAVVENIVREGETINIVSATKIGKTWFTHGLALSVCAGADWLGFRTHKGRVLILDNELHEPTFCHRIKSVADAMGLREADYAEQLDVECYRGRLVDIHAVCEKINRIPPGTYKMIVLDSLYRFAPKGSNENDNSETTELYNAIDAMAARMGCAAVCVRHTSKGNQSGKGVTDVGAGAGAQSRTVDAHLVLRHHEEAGAVVLDGALRSWAPMQPMALRWTFPLFTLAPDLDPLLLAPDKPRKPKATGDGSPPIPEWNAERFAQAFITNVPQPRAALIEAAMNAKLSKAQAEHFMRICEGNGTAHLHRGPDRRQKLYANLPQFQIVD
jgi:AAA domain